MWLLGISPPPPHTLSLPISLRVFNNTPQATPTQYCKYCVFVFFFFFFGWLVPKIVGKLRENEWTRLYLKMFERKNIIYWKTAETGASAVRTSLTSRFTAGGTPVTTRVSAMNTPTAVRVRETLTLQGQDAGGVGRGGGGYRAFV